MKIKLLFVSLLMAVTAYTAFAQERVDTSTAKKIRNEGLNHSKVMETAFYLSDVSGPRITGSPELKHAQDWAINELKLWGIANAKREKWGNFGNGWEVKKNYAAITLPYYHAIVGIPKAWTPGTNGSITEDVILIKADSVPDLDQYRGKLDGKIVILDKEANEERNFKPDATRLTATQLDELEKAVVKPVLPGPPMQLTPQNAPWLFAMLKAQALSNSLNEFCKKENVSLLLSQADGKDGTVFTSAGASHNVNAPAACPELETSGEDYQRILRLLKAGIKVSMEADIKTNFYAEDTDGYNIIAEIPGTDKNLTDQVVMIGAHLDSWHAATGATDNAAGAAVMMEAMRILKTINIKPRRTIRLALWSAEEEGFKGSQGYVFDHFGDPNTMILKPEYEKISAYYNLDDGTGRIDGIYAQNNPAVKPIFKTWLDQFKDLTPGVVTMQYTGSTDHDSFEAVGIPGFQFIQDPLDYNSRTHHSNQDTYDKLNEDDLKQAAVIIAWFAYNTAQRDDMIPRKELPKLQGK